VIFDVEITSDNTWEVCMLILKLHHLVTCVIDHSIFVLSLTKSFSLCNVDECIQDICKMSKKSFESFEAIPKINGYVVRRDS
jgi:hypothetical protein